MFALLAALPLRLMGIHASGECRASRKIGTSLAPQHGEEEGTKKLVGRQKYGCPTWFPPADGAQGSRSEASYWTTEVVSFLTTGSSDRTVDFRG